MGPSAGNDAQQGKNEGYPTADKAVALELLEGGVGFHGSLPAAIILGKRCEPRTDMPPTGLLRSAMKA